MAQDAKHSEIAACLASIERIIERSKASPNAISYPELRALDLICKDALQRALPEHPTYAQNWYVNENKGSKSPDEIHSEFLQKRQSQELLRAQSGH
jgi:hypothetical protein